jgi:serine/threonine protein kinase
MKGQVLGHYKVLEQIGTGGMGEVYRARDERLGRDVALKLVRPSSAKDPDRLRRFEHEARAAAALNHPNIVAIYDIGMHEGCRSLSLNFWKGRPCASAWLLAHFLFATLPISDCRSPKA